MKPLDTELARKRLGERIAELRKKEKISQRQLAEKSNVHRVHLNKIEHGEINVTINTLASIADALYCHVDFAWGKESELK